MDSTNFDRELVDFENGFGESIGSYWLGLSVVNMLTTVPGVSYTLRIDLHDCDGNAVYEIYDNFSVSVEFQLIFTVPHFFLKR